MEPWTWTMWTPLVQFAPSRLDDGGLNLNFVNPSLSYNLLPDGLRMEPWTSTLLALLVQFASWQIENGDLNLNFVNPSRTICYFTAWQWRLELMQFDDWWLDPLSCNLSVDSFRMEPRTLTLFTPLLQFTSWPWSSTLLTPLVQSASSRLHESWTSTLLNPHAQFHNWRLENGTLKLNFVNPTLSIC
jgi:hypothetical protein